MSDGLSKGVCVCECVCVKEGKVGWIMVKFGGETGENWKGEAERSESQLA